MSLASLKKKVKEQIANLHDGDCRLCETGELLVVITLIEDEEKKIKERIIELEKRIPDENIVSPHLEWVLGEEK